MMGMKRPSIPEDTVFFSVHTWSSSHGSCTEEEKMEDLQKKLRRLQTDCLALILSLSEGYIWQHETFNLSLHHRTIANSCFCSSPPHTLDDDSIEPRELPAPLPPHLHGKLKYGDNIEEEWFVVYLLFAISRQFPEVSIRVWDTDGEFLLIEAAYSIPRWLKPENSWNRVFIRQNELHILPLPSSPAELFHLPVLPSLEDALTVLNTGNYRTRAEGPVQAVIQRRLSNYQRNPNMYTHSVICRVPLPVAQILKHEPQLVALAVGAFYDRDMDSMKAASQMSYFVPSGKEVQMVDVVVRMSRAMYAQLMQQVFQAPRCYPMPHRTDPYYVEAELGMKLTCGFEMMHWERAGYDAEGKASISTGSKDVGWQTFLASLQRTGYFKDLLKGSKEHRELMDRAVTQYRKTSLFARVSTAMNAPIQHITEILALPHSVHDFPRLEDTRSDDDSWLYNGEDDLRNAMFERQKEMDIYELNWKKTQMKRRPCTTKGKELSEDFSAEEDFNAEEVVKSMHTFIDKLSSYEGAELPCDKAELRGDDEPVDVSSEVFWKELYSAMDDYQLESKKSQTKGSKGKCGSLPRENQHALYKAEARGDDAPANQTRALFWKEMESALRACCKEASSDMSSSDTDFDDIDDDSDTMERDLMTVEDTPSTSSKHSNLKGRMEEESDFMEEYSETLHTQLNSSSVAKSFVRVEQSPLVRKENEVTNDMEGLPPPVDIDMNLIQNLLASYSSQHGLPGPASNLLGVMGLHLPDEKDKK